MTQQISIELLDQDTFAPYGDVLDVSGDPSKMINNGKCARFSDRAKLDFDPAGRAGISIFRGQPYSLPLQLTMVERHPLGSQAFMPISGGAFLVIVAGDKDGAPTTPRAFLTERYQGVNIHRGIWHGVLTPLNAVGLFTVVDWIGDAQNLEEHYFDSPWQVDYDV